MIPSTFLVKLVLSPYKAAAFVNGGRLAVVSNEKLDL